MASPGLAGPRDISASEDPASPSPEIARKLRGIADARLLDSLAYLGKVAEGEGSVRARFDDWASSLAAAKELLDDGYRLRAVAYSIHTELVESLRAGHADTVASLIGMLPSLRIATTAEPPVVTFGHSASGDHAEDYEWHLLSSVLDRENRRAYNREFDAAAVDANNLVASKFAFRIAMDALDECDPYTALEYRILVTDTVVITSRYINAGTSFRAFGYVLLQELGVRAWTTYLEEMVHEAAHLYLYLLWTQDPIVAGDDNPKYRSPLRTESRPMSAVFHAMFVLARTVRMLRVVAANDKYAEDIEAIETSYNYAKNPDSFEAKFYEAYDTVCRHGILTPFGERLLASTLRLVTD